MLEEILKFSSPAIGLVITLLLAKIFGVNRNKNKITHLIEEIIELIFDVEETNNRTGKQKFAEVCRTMFRTLRPKSLSLLKREYGSLEQAVQVAYRQTNLASNKQLKTIIQGGKQNG